MCFLCVLIVEVLTPHPSAISFVHLPIANKWSISSSVGLRTCDPQIPSWSRLTTMERTPLAIGQKLALQRFKLPALEGA
jgi:hypothetical protein